MAQNGPHHKLGDQIKVVDHLEHIRREFLLVFPRPT